MNKSVSYILWIDPISEGAVMITVKIIYLKMENPRPILTVKIIEWGQLLDDFGINIEAGPSRVKTIFFHIGFIPISLSGHPHLAMYKLYKELNLGPPTLRIYQLTKMLLLKLRLPFFLP